MKHPSAPLKEACVVITDGTHYTPKAEEHGRAFLTVKDMIDGHLDFKNCGRISEADFQSALRNGCCPLPGDVLFSKDGTVGKVHPFTFEEDCAVLSSIAILRPRSEVLDQAYFAHFLKSDVFLRKALRNKTGSAVRRIILANLKGLEIPLPPLEEQRRIAAILGSANSVLELAKEKARRTTTALYKSLLKQELNQIEADWIRLGEVLEIARGGSPRPIQQYLTDDPGGINWVMIGDTKVGEKYITNTAKRIRTEGLTKTRMVQEGDLLLSNSMSFGRPYIMKIKGAIHDGWLVLRDAHEACNSDYLYHVLGSQICYSQFARAAAGATVKNLNTSIVSSVEIPLPPLSKQREIAHKLDSVELKLGLKIASLELKSVQLKDSLANSLIQKFS